MALLRIGRILQTKSAEPGAEQYWTQYFLREKDFYEKLLKGEARRAAPYRHSLTTSAWISSK